MCDPERLTSGSITFSVVLYNFSEVGSDTGTLWFSPTGAQSLISLWQMGASGCLVSGSFQDEHVKVIAFK